MVAKEKLNGIGHSNAKVRIPPGVLTSYDFWKSFALITMAIDHMGFYLFPDEPIWRLIGRFSLPVWLFLIGFARTRDIGLPIIGSAFGLLATNFVFGEHVLPLNILFTIILVRLSIDAVMLRALQSKWSLLSEFLFLAILFAPTFMLFDYGTHAVLFAMLGYATRHQALIDWHRNQLILLALAVGVVHGVTQAYLYHTVGWQTLLVISGVGMISLMLTRFRAEQFPLLTEHLPFAVVKLVQLMGRHTLFLYVFHLLILKFLATWLVWGGFRWFEWRWFLNS